jgi:myosin-5
VFKHEQSLYEREGIEWSFIQFPDNADIIDLLENRRTGMFALCDDQVRLARASDLTLVSKFYEHYGTHARFMAGPKEKANNLFVIKHYAGPVVYTSQSFLEKNHDVIRYDVANLVRTSSNAIINKLYDFMRVDEDPGLSVSSVTSTAATAAGKKPQAAGGSTGPSSRRAGASAKVTTLSAEFRNQLEELMKKINGTSPHYVRCLKSNSRNVGDCFEPDLIISQLRCGGVLEAVRVSRAGYPNRFSFDQFVRRYSILFPSLYKSKAVRAPKDLAKDLSAHLARLCWDSPFFIPSADAAHLTDPMQRAGIQMGKTIVFLRSRTFEFLERELQMLRIRACISVQACFRRYSAMAKYRIVRASAIMIQCFVRAKSAKLRVQAMREDRARRRLQRCWRGSLARLRARRLRAGIRRLQAVARGGAARRRVTALRKSVRAAIALQCSYRIVLAKRNFQKRKIEARSLQAVRVFLSCSLLALL